MADISVSQQAKRKRGRPRKDNNLYRDGGGLQSPENSSLMKTQPLDKNSNNGLSVDNSRMAGGVVHGVIEGSFDAGYLISVTIGNDHTLLRGVVFQPKKIIPISASNDVAPQVKMYDRRAISISESDNLNQTRTIPVPDSDNLNETRAISVPDSNNLNQTRTAPVPDSDNLNQTRTIQVPVSDILNQTSGISVPNSQPERASKQAIFRPPSSSFMSSTNHDATMMMMRTTTSPYPNMGSGKTTSPDHVCKPFSNVDPSGASLRMVEEDEVMQAFEVSTSGGVPLNSESNVQLNLMEKNMPPSTFEMNIGCDAEHTRSFLNNGPTMELLHETPTAVETGHVQPPIYFSESFHQNLFSEPKSLSETQYDPGETSHNLKLGLETECTGSERSYGYHQALVAGNPLLLPPDVMMEKTRSPIKTNSEPESRSGVGSYKLEDNTPTLNTRPTAETNYCMGDMNFVMNDVRAAESHHHQTDQVSETTHA